MNTIPNTPTTITSNEKKVIIVSAPSGSGKSTLIRHMLERFPQLEFSISATSRPSRGEEMEGREYYFISNEEFKNRVAAGEFVEWEEVYPGTCYGTLVRETERIWNRNHVIIFDVDVKGGVKLKNIFGARALSIFIMPPSIEELRNRLVLRGTDTPEVIEKRVAKAREELTYQPEFDATVINDQLDEAIELMQKRLTPFLSPQ